MDDLLQFVPEDKREEFLNVAKNYVKADPDEIKRNTSLFDRIVDGPIRTREKNLREIEFPKLLEAEKDRLRKEFAPKEETPEQSRLRELENKLAAKEAKELEFERRNSLRSKYKDVAPDIAERLHLLDDESVDGVVNHIGELKNRIAELEKVNRYGSKAPSGGVATAPNDIDTMRKQYIELSNAGKSTEAMQVWLALQQRMKE